MKHLLLFRHAKSSWDFPELQDFDRPLNGRGQNASRKMANYLTNSVVLPDFIICSTSQRTRETLMALMNVYNHPVRIHMAPSIYESSYLSILNEINQVADTVETLMVIGHNPGMEDLACVLCGEGNTASLNMMNEKYPTAACAHISFENMGWSEIGRDKGYLENFVRPGDLED